MERFGSFEKSKLRSNKSYYQSLDRDLSEEKARAIAKRFSRSLEYEKLVFCFEVDLKKEKTCSHDK
jgi:hypothetical protein